MINVNWEQLLGEFRGLANDYRNLPAHIAKKHLLAAMRRAITESGGVKLLRANTPPVGTRRGRRRKGEKRSTGNLRRSVTTKAKWIGTNKGGAAVAGLGYKYNSENRNAIWQEYGTTRMRGLHMMQRTYDSIKGKVASLLSRKLADALEKAAGEVGGGKNKGYGG